MSGEENNQREQTHKHWQSYYWSCAKQFGKECIRTWKGEVISALAGGFASVAVALFKGDKSASFTDAIEGAGIVFAFYAAGHLLRTPWLLHRNEGEEPRTWYGFFGVTVLLCLLSTSGFTAWWYYSDLRSAISLSASADQGAKNAESIQEINGLKARIADLTQKEPTDSLRRRTLNLANDIGHYIEDRWTNHPERAYPDPKDPNPTEERKKAIQKCLKWDQDTLNYYRDHFKDKWIGIVREYAAKGVKTGWLENDAMQNQAAQSTMFPFSPAEENGTYMSALSRFRELAYHVDARGNLIDLH